MGYDQERRETHKELKNPPKAVYINEIGDIFYEAVSSGVNSFYFSFERVLIQFQIKLIPFLLKDLLLARDFNS